jgi:hypothetical protein
MIGEPVGLRSLATVPTILAGRLTQLRDSPAWPVVRSVIWLIVAATIVPSQADPDLWGHVRFGLDLVRTRHFPSIDPYSFTQDVPWVNHEWLSEVIMALSYRSGGPIALVLLKTLIAGSALALVARQFRNTAPLLIEAVTAVVLWASLPLIGTIRPQLWTFLGIAILCAILLKPSRRNLTWMPLLFVVWANMHGGWIVGMAVLWLWAAGEVLRPESPDLDRSTIVVVVLLSALATLATPNAGQLWWFIARTVRLSRPDITEWGPLWTTPAANWIPWLVTVAAGAYAAFRRKVPLNRLLPMVALGCVSLRVARLTPLFVELAVVFLAPRQPLAGIPPSRTSTRRPLRAVRLINTFAVGGVIVAVAVSMRHNAGCIRMRDWQPDPSAVLALQHAGATGKLAVWFDWGEYALWHLSPGLKISIDGRRETIYSEATLREQRALSHGDPEGLNFISRTRPEYVWFPAASTRLKSALTRLGYRLDMDTARAFLAVRDDLPPAIVDGSRGGSGSGDPGVTDCFPGP